MQQAPVGGAPNRDKYDMLFKVIIVGDTSTGKSCILQRFVENKFYETQGHTIGVEFGSKIFTIGQYRIKLQIWDTAGQDRYRSVTRSYYRGAAAALVVYDLTSRESFTHVPQWLSDTRTLAGDDAVVCLVGNKTDLSEDARQVPMLEASKFAQENNIMFLETSAFSGDNVDECFTKCAKVVLTRMKEKDTTGFLDLNASGLDLDPSAAAETEKPAKSGCAC